MEDSLKIRAGTIEALVEIGPVDLFFSHHCNKNNEAIYVLVRGHVKLSGVPIQAIMVSRDREVQARATSVSKVVAQDAGPHAKSCPGAVEKNRKNNTSMLLQLVPPTSISLQDIAYSEYDPLYKGANGTIFAATSVVLINRKTKKNGRGVTSKSFLCPVDEDNQSTKPDDNAARKGNQYVVKILNPAVRQSSRALDVGRLHQQSAADLSKEAQYLQSLSHPNIAKMRAADATSVGDTTSSQIPRFYVLDRFECSLDQQIISWKEQVIAEAKRVSAGRPRTRKLLRSTSSEKGPARHILHPRLQAAFEVASALKYMHDRNIIHRNLRPGHVGFVKGRAVLIGLELAEEVDSHTRKDSSGSFDEDAVYALQGNVGPIIYMAPEVRRCLPYNLKADVYSFGILLYEIMALEPAFQNMCSRKFSDDIVYGSRRPRIKKGWSKGIQALIPQCWDAQSSNRPNIYNVQEVLRDESSASGGSPLPTLSHSRHYHSDSSTLASDLDDDGIWY